MAYWFVPFPETLDDLEGHSPVAGLIKCNSTNIYATFCTVSTNAAHRAVRGDSWTSCNNFWRACSIERWYNFPSHLICVSALPCKTWNTEIASLVSVVCLFETHCRTCWWLCAGASWQPTLDMLWARCQLGHQVILWLWEHSREDSNEAVYC